MARKNNNQAKNTGAANNPHYADATICGVVVDYYDKGKKYDYVTVDVPHGYDEYYDRFKVAVNKNWECPDNGETVTIECTLKCYKGDVSLKEINADLN